MAGWLRATALRRRWPHLLVACATPCGVALAASDALVPRVSLGDALPPLLDPKNAPYWTRDGRLIVEEPGYAPLILEVDASGRTVQLDDGHVLLGNRFWQFIVQSTFSIQPIVTASNESPSSREYTEPDSNFGGRLISADGSFALRGHDDPATKVYSLNLTKGPDFDPSAATPYPFPFKAVATTNPAGPSRLLPEAKL